MRTSHALAITALLALKAGPIVAQDSLAPGNTLSVESRDLTAVPTDAHVDISRRAVATPYDWNTSHSEHRSTMELTEEPMTLRSILMVFGVLLFMFSAAIFTLAFAYRSMRAQMRQERIHYQPRGPTGHSALEQRAG